MDLVRGSPSRFTLDPGIDFSPVWSPDSSQIAFASNRAGTFDLYQKRSTGGREELLFKINSRGVCPNAWLSDGRLLVYTVAGSKTGFDLWVLALSGERKASPFMETIFNETEGQISADGKWIAYTSDETGVPEVYVQPFPATGAKWQVSVAGGSDPHWRLDGRELFYVAGDGTLMAIPVTGTASTFEAGAAQALFQTRRPVARGPLIFTAYAPSADGQRFLVNRLAADVPPLPITVVLNWAAGLKR
jgi:Tol biopolymer transport system component